MKFGVCVNMLKQSPTETGIQFAKKVAAFGYDYVEMPLAETMLMSDSAFEDAKERLKETGIPCRSCNNFFPRELKLVGPKVDHQAIRNYYTRAIDRAAQMGVQYIGFGSPWSKEVPEGFPKDEAYRQLVQLCKEIGPVAAGSGITIVLEHNNKTETNILNQFHEIGKLAEEVNHPNICVLVDYYHICMENEPIDNIPRYAKYLKHAHFARHEKRGYPKSMDEDANYARFIDALRQSGFDGGMSIEAFPDDFETDGPATLQFFRENFSW